MEGGVTKLHTKELSKKDKMTMLRSEADRVMLDPDYDQPLIEGDPLIDVEQFDTYLASRITIKFKSVKTPTHLPTESVTIPSKLFFTYKFFTFKTTTTETVQMRQVQLSPDGQVIKQYDPPSSHNIKLGTQYSLASTTSAVNTRSLTNHNIQELEEVHVIDPEISGVKEDHACLANYL